MIVLEGAIQNLPCSHGEADVNKMKTVAQKLAVVLLTLSHKGQNVNHRLLLVISFIC